MKSFVFLAIILLALVSIWLLMNNSDSNKSVEIKAGQVRYVALGDSYTIGSGVSELENFPSQLVRKLQEKSIDITLVANPAVSGFTTDDLIAYELSEFDKSQATFVTLLIGANDVASGMSKQRYAENLQYILDHVQDRLSNKKNTILLTIPDFSLTPVGIQFGGQEKIREELKAFNAIIVEEGNKRDLPVVDLYEVSQAVQKDQSLIISDGLHPDRRQYELWVEEILPLANSLLAR